MIRRINTAAELEATPVGSIIGTGFGHSVLIDSDISNSESYMEDRGQVVLLALPSSYEDSPLIESGEAIGEEVSDFAGFVIYEEATMEPYSVALAGYIRQHPGIRFKARAIRYP